VSRSSRWLSTSTRVAVAVTLVLAAGIVALSFVASWRVTERLRADLDRSLLREAEAYSAAVHEAGGPDLESETRAYLLARSQTFSASYPILLVRFANGKVLSDSPLKLEEAPVNRAALDTTTSARAFLDVTYQGTTYRAATVPLLSKDGTVEGVFEAALPASATDLGFQVLATLLGVGAFIIAVGALLAVWVARASLWPLTQASDTAARVTRASLGERIDFDGPDDEVGRLASSVNSMLDRLEDAFREQRHFTADASHELRTPLQVIAGHVELLRDTPMSEEDRREELDLIADEVGRMSRLVDDLLALARLESEVPTTHQPLEVASLLEEAAARGRVLGERSITIDVAGDPWVDGDPDQLMQALLNLVGNAVAHTKPGGAVGLSAQSSDGSVRIEVTDDGPGIRPEDLPRLFDRFYRAHGPRTAGTTGSGLGLPITKRLVDLHGGSISGANRATGGAVFTIELPRIAPPVAGEGEAAALEP
jgi:two-component system, OmpR family, sensor kinase